MKFFLFADFHFAPGIFRGGDMDALRLFQRRAEEEGCDFMIHLGDYTNNCRPEHLEMINAYQDFHIPSYHVIGNHEADNAPFEKVLELYRLKSGYYYFDIDGYRIIATDPNYCFDGKEYYHFSMGNYHTRGGERDWLPPEQIAWLRETIATAPGPCLIMSHSSYERPDGVRNRDDVRAVIDEANRRRPHSVLACFNGHHHHDNARIMANVLYFDVNCVCFDWLEKRHDCYPEELCQKITSLSHTVCYEDPLYCIVTIEGTHIKIEGAKSKMFLGINRAEAGCQIYDAAGRAVVPYISDLDITL